MATAVTALAPDARVLDESSVTRTVIVKPGMCGHNSLFLGQVGDWTWETVSALCGTNAFAASNAAGAPTYLSFCYYRVKASPHMHVNGLRFGDLIEVTSRLYNVGGESVQALHRITRADPGREVAPIEPDGFYAYADPGSLYVENFNRWITRSREHSNENLVRSSPVGFRHGHLPVLPEAYSPRHAYDLARRRLTLLHPAPDGWQPVAEPFTVDYRVDITRDLNGVGLLYFASYFSIVDHGLLAYWRQSGRSDEAFLRRIVLDQRMCYLGNADAGSVLRIEVAPWARPGERERGEGIVNVVVTERGSGRPIAVCTLHLLTEEGL